MLKFAKQTIQHLPNRYPKWICRQEFESQAFTRFYERPIEFGFVFRKLVEIYPRTILDVGTGQPHLNEILDRPDIEQLIQRVKLRYNIPSLRERRSVNIQRTAGVLRGIARCPHCHRGTLRIVARLAPQPHPPP